jgi:hypothetical protein
VTTAALEVVPARAQMATTLVGPSFALLFALQGRQVLRHEGTGIAFAGGPASGTGGSPARAGPASRAAALGLVAAGALLRALTRRRRAG